jgi:hypothetical protein
MSRVYCSTCTHCRAHEDFRYGIEYQCRHPNNIILKRSFYDTHEEYDKECPERNAHNNCDDYTERKSLWSIVIALFQSK